MFANTSLIRHQEMWYPAGAIFEKYLTMDLSDPVQDEVGKICTPLSEQSMDNQFFSPKPPDVVQINITFIFVISFCYVDSGPWKSRLDTVEIRSTFPFLEA